MKVKPLLSKVNLYSFIEDYLSALGIKNTEKYLSPVGNYDSPSLYVNMDAAVMLLKQHIESKRKIAVLVD